jgi:hypothetical protein
MTKSSPRVFSCLALAGCLLLLVFCTGLLAKAPACPGYEEMRPMLNSQRIASCFGSYGVDVLKQEDKLRISSLYSRESQGAVTRTLAISEFAVEKPGELPPGLQAAYQAIRDGASMGATLEAAGWQVEKRDRFIGQLPEGDVLACLSGWPQAPAESYPGQAALAVQVYDLYARRGDAAVRFALLAEIHDPRYLDLHDLQSLAGASVQTPETSAQLDHADPDSTAILHDLAGFCATRQ